MPAYFGPWRVISDDPVSPQQLALARKLVGGMLEVGGIPSRRWDLPDGSVIQALIVNGIPKVTVTQAKSASVSTDTLFDLWAPRGFLIYPCYSNAPKGVGLPVVQQGTDPYAKANLDPGLDIARWTPGGPHGQVLLTKDVDAGYPADPIAQPVPIAFGTQGPSVAEPSTYDSRKMGATWLAFRPRYSDFVQHYANDPTAPRRATFAAINAYRVKNNLPATFLWPAGFYRPAEVLAYVLDANGLNQSAFPIGYQTTAERLTKDGDWGIVPGTYAEQTTGGDPVLAFTGPTGIALTQGYYPAWPVFADVGFSNGQWALSIEDRSQWIGAGRKSFQSSDAGLPPISWDGYPSVNLGYATFPYFLNTSNSAVYALTTPIVGTSYYASFMQSNIVQRQALGSRIYCRGRAIAELPNGGLVLGAGICALPGIDRLIVVAHQPADNIGLDAPTHGFMRFARVWYYDFVSDKTLRLHSDSFISGTQWKDGGVFDVGGTKYDSLWSFDPSGQKAVCLRDYATLTDLLKHASYTTEGYVSMYAGALKGAAVELHGLDAGAPSLSVTMLSATIDLPPIAPYYSVNGSMASLWSSAPPWIIDKVDAETFFPPLWPLAVDYVAGAITVAYLGGFTFDYTGYPYGFSDFPDGNYPFYTCYFHYVGTGPVTAKYVNDLTAPTLISSSKATPGNDFAMTRCPQVADIATGTFVISGWTANYTITPVEITLSDGSKLLLVSASETTANAASPACVLNTATAVYRVRVVHNGAVVNDSSYPYPSPYLGGTLDLGYRARDQYETPVAGATPLAFADFSLSDVVQPFFASRFGETIFGYQVAANSMLRSYYDFGAKCAPDSVDYAAAQNAGISVTPTTDSFKPMGGWYQSSFPIPGAGAGWYSEALVC